MKLLLPLFLLASSLVAQPAFFTAHGKTWHSSRDCMALARSKNVLQADSSDAERHGLVECSICAHRHAGSHAKAKNDNSAWGKAEAK